MLKFRQKQKPPELPEGYILETNKNPSPTSLNNLLESCDESTHPENLWPIALERSLWQISILDKKSGELVGFVRATSDLALNANLWNLSAKPGPDQTRLLKFLVHRALNYLKKDLPGCSLSVSAPKVAVEALESNGFLIDPTGIKAMGLNL